jgi:hypothetical protein
MGSLLYETPIPYTDWRLIAKERTEWAGIVSEEKVLQGP